MPLFPSCQHGRRRRRKSWVHLALLLPFWTKAAQSFCTQAAILICEERKKKNFFFFLFTPFAISIYLPQQPPSGIEYYFWTRARWDIWKNSSGGNAKLICNPSEKDVAGVLLLLPSHFLILFFARINLCGLVLAFRFARRGISIDFRRDGLFKKKKK